MQNFNWETETSHSDNTETMNDYLENHLPAEFHILMQDGTYADIQSVHNAEIYRVHASGDGDFTHHSVRFEMLS